MTKRQDNYKVQLFAAQQDLKVKQKMFNQAERALNAAKKLVEQLTCKTF